MTVHQTASIATYRHSNEPEGAFPTSTHHGYVAEHKSALTLCCLPLTLAPGWLPKSAAGLHTAKQLLAGQDELA